ncbi:DUF3617 domain-containing protein [Pseudoblastomonas halimionae]|uniref:DUF3617 family protein n=1 Tax=Alteriqipengyuania halimionae TaxID=1926630 RepID=A0A6I4U2I1_9SPHN|nr:DUF3617 domain-containing protein [Alteriqipengyuania halimionae]MXP08672.1 DUF3617 family protein [Alteriqipengyuania halimionae]
MRRELIMATACLALAACGSSDADTDGDGKVSMEEAARKSADEMIKPEPGQYRAEIELVEFEMPDAPPEMQELIKQQSGKGKETREFCLSDEDAEKGFEDMIREGQQNDDCSFDKFEADGGKIDAVMLCEKAGEGKARMEITGVGTKTSSDMTMKVEATGPGGQKVLMTTKMKQERIGDCPG